MKKRVLLCALVLLVAIGGTGAFAMDFGIDVAMPIMDTAATPWIDFNLGFEKLDVLIGIVPPTAFGDKFALGLRSGVGIHGPEAGNAAFSFPIYFNFKLGGDMTNIGFWAGGKIDYAFSEHIGVFAKAAISALGLTLGGEDTGSSFGLLNGSSTEIGVAFTF
jgi:hypothetical protein